MRNGADWLSDLTCVVSDEVHLIDDRNRGPTLEVTLAKLRQLNPGLQVVALSATVGNADEIADWLDAALVDSDWRPIDLRTGVHYGNALNFDDGSSREVPIEGSEKQEAALVRDILEEGGSSLVFVNSRRNAEAAARRLGGVSSPELTDEERTELTDLAAEIRDDSDTETSQDLADCVERGAAFHHAGLSTQRSLVEDAFRDRLLKVISATPTLAAGVNTPARRVVVRDWRRFDPSAGGMAPLDVLEVHQMMGRAGRPGSTPTARPCCWRRATTRARSCSTATSGPNPRTSARSSPPNPPCEHTPSLPSLRALPAPARAARVSRPPSMRASRPRRVASSPSPTTSSPISSATTSSSARAAAGADDDADGAFTSAADLAEQASREEELEATSLGHTVSRLYLDPMSAAEIVHGLEGAKERPTALGSTSSSRAPRYVRTLPPIR